MKPMKLISSLYVDNTSNGVRIMKSFLFERAVKERDKEILDRLNLISKTNNVDLMKSKIKDLVFVIEHSQY